VFGVGRETVCVEGVCGGRMVRNGPEMVHC
jgi:hypothetical protein